MKKNIILLVYLLSTQVFGQNLIQNANKKFGNQEWESAAKDYTEHLKKNGTDSSAWYSLAFCQMKMREYDKSIENFQKAKETNFNPVFVDFNLSKAYALKGDTQDMYSALESAAQNGLPTYTRLISDKEFEQYQDSDRFQKILKKVELNAYPCLSNSNFRHFDFWIGEWDVYANGRKAGVNSITKAKGGCAIHENYTTAGNYSGQSINFYSPVDKKWHQHWVGSSGDVYNYIETKREEGLLQFVSEFMGPQGSITLSRLTFTLNEDGTVRQLFESSSDDGKTWTPAFDGLYKRKN
ncbi:tetratricopeptide repeat protein [Ekhidna sp.]